MRVAIVCDYFLDYVGGAQTSLLQQRDALTAEGHEVVMISARRGKRGVWSDEGNVYVTPAFTLPGVQLPVMPNSARLRDQLRGVLRRRGIEAVHIQSEFPLAHAVADVAAELHLPVVHTVHTFYWASEGTWHAPLAPLLRRLLTRFTGRSIPQEKLSPRPVDNLLRNLTLAMGRYR